MAVLSVMLCGLIMTKQIFEIMRIKNSAVKLSCNSSGFFKQNKIHLICIS